MSEPNIPKEKLTAYQRWEMHSFDEPVAAQADAVVLPTAAEMEALHQSAYQEGYQAGYQNGINQGLAEMTAKISHAAQLLGNVENELVTLDETVSRDIVSLAVSIANAVLHHSLRIKPDLLLSIVNDAVAQVPPFGQHAHLLLHPDDARLVKESLGERLEQTGWKIIEDAGMLRGGCKIQTGTTHVDATLQTRWKKVVASISEDDSWLDYEKIHG